jgi:hypothetical protein
MGIQAIKDSGSTMKPDSLHPASCTCVNRFVILRSLSAHNEGDLFLRGVHDQRLIERA